VLLLIPSIVAVFKATRRHYDHVASQLTLARLRAAARAPQHVLIPIGGLSAPWSRRCATPKRCQTTCARLRRRRSGGTEHVRRTGTVGRPREARVLPSPFRSLMEPLLEYIEQVESERHDDYVTVILPEFVPASGGSICFTTSERC
jgi:hypothetical protein